MADTGQKINYNLRFAKHVERKMLCDAFLETNPFGRIKEYRYIGFGSFYFNDFILFHKRLGLRNMMSIEAMDSLKVRCNRNKPFDCIELKPGKAGEVLRDITFSWQEKTILWLDYDKALQNGYIEDIEFTCLRLLSGSIILITVNAHPGREVPSDSLEPNRIDMLKNKLDEQYLPIGLKQEGLAGWGTARLYRDIIDAVIKRAINDVFATKPASERLVYQQLFNFHYDDGTKMLTVGGIVFSEQDRRLVEQCGFDALSFVRKGDNPFLVHIPQLTYREMKYLDTCMPQLSDLCENDAESAKEKLNQIAEAEGIPADDTRRYANMYRFFPTFVDAEV